MHREKMVSDLFCFSKRLYFPTVNLVSRRKNSYLTVESRKDGGGAQGMRTLSAKVYARNAGIPYLHSPFKTVAHNPDDVSSQEWALIWEKFLGLGCGCRVLEEPQVLELRKQKIESVTSIRSGKDTLYTIGDGFGYTYAFPNSYAPFKEELIEHLDLGNQYPAYCKNGSFCISIHIRRGDVFDLARNSFMVTENQVIIRALEQIISVTESLTKDYEIKIFSEGLADDFADIQNSVSSKITFHLDGCPLTTFKTLVESDVLLMAKSSFSFLASLYSDSVKICERLWHPPMSTWLKMSEKGEIDARALKEAVSKHLKKNSN